MSLYGYSFCFAAVACFSGFYLLLGIGEKQKGDPTGLNLVACFVGGGFSLVSAWPTQTADFPSAVLVIGSLLGVTAFIGFLGMIMALKSGILVSVVNTVMSLAMVVPVGLSILVYHERPHLRILAGGLLAGASVYLLQRR